MVKTKIISQTSEASKESIHGKLTNLIETSLDQVVEKYFLPSESRKTLRSVRAYEAHLGNVKWSLNLICFKIFSNKSFQTFSPASVWIVTNICEWLNPHSSFYFRCEIAEVFLCIYFLLIFFLSNRDEVWSETDWIRVNGGKSLIHYNLKYMLSTRRKTIMCGGQLTFKVSCSFRKNFCMLALCRSFGGIKTQHVDE